MLTYVIFNYTYYCFKYNTFREQINQQYPTDVYTTNTVLGSHSIYGLHIK